jgi:hypothetical protein
MLLPTENQVVGDRIIENKSPAMAILGDVGQPGVRTFAHAEAGDFAWSECDGA